MKKLIAGIIVFIYLSAQAQVSFDSSNRSLNINFGNVQRISNGVGLIASKEAGRVNAIVKNGVAILSLSIGSTVGSNQFAGVFFNKIPQFKQGVVIWRYKPWNSWTKPVAVADATKMQDWDVQFFYWQYDDGLYGAAVPLSGNGFRTTLGSDSGKWGSKAVSYATDTSKTIPALAVAFGNDPYELFARIYHTALEAMGKPENERARKTMPEPLQYIGWCTWNASNNGRDLNEAHIIEGVKTFTDNKFPLGWVLVDDGWFQQQHSQLQSFQPDPQKFPNGFKPLIQKLKTQYGIKYTGLWHAFDGYWNGIDPASPLGRRYKNKLFSWQQPERVDVDSSPVQTYYFIKPEKDYLYGFYNDWHGYLKKEGFDFVKVDNQLVAERMAVANYPLFNLSDKMHTALYQSINKHLNGAVINCMDMTAEAYLNFGPSAVARAVEDYFPYEKGETYNLQRGNAAAHVLQALYNSLYFSQMVFPDFDMFQSHNPNAVLHALARTLNNGPIYLTDNPGEQNFDLLNKIVFSDGRSIRSGSPLLPAKECLFQLQEAQLFKAFSRVRTTGLLALFNLADAEQVTGRFKPADVEGLKGDAFALYDYFSGQVQVAKRTQSIEVHLPRLGYQLQYVVPVKNGFAAFGLIDKYNAPATIIHEAWARNRVALTLYESGHFKAYTERKPKKVLVNGKEASRVYDDKMLRIDIPVSLKKPTINISWQ